MIVSFKKQTPAESFCSGRATESGRQYFSRRYEASATTTNGSTSDWELTPKSVTHASTALGGLKLGVPRQACFAKPGGLHSLGVLYEVDFLACLVTGEELRLDVAECGLGLLSGLAEGLYHEDLLGR
jgi:hypothetical protein